jgi:GDP-mannose pyrophosphatase NudK
MSNLKVIQEKILFNDIFTIEEGTISDGKGKEFKRLRLQRQDSSAVLIHNTDSNKIILVKQFRYPISSTSSEDILEIVAGRIDKGEDPLTTAIRETEEEAGYRIQPSNIKLLVSCFSSPGYSTERFFIYVAKVSNSDKVSKGGGLASENEQIEIVEVNADEFKEMIYSGKLSDAKTYIAGFSFFSKNQ